MTQLPKTEPNLAEQKLRFAELSNQPLEPYKMMVAMGDFMPQIQQLIDAQILTSPNFSVRIEGAAGMIAQTIATDEGYNYVSQHLIWTHLIGAYEPYQTRVDAIKAELLKLLTDYADYCERGLNQRPKEILAGVKVMAQSIEDELPRLVEMLGVKRHCEQSYPNCDKCKYKTHAWCMKNAAKAREATLHTFNPADLDADLKTKALAELGRELPYIQFDDCLKIVGTTQPLVKADLEKLQSILAPYMVEHLARNGTPIILKDIKSLEFDKHLPAGE